MCIVSTGTFTSLEEIFTFWRVFVTFTDTVNSCSTFLLLWFDLFISELLKDAQKMAICHLEWLLL